MVAENDEVVNLNAEGLRSPPKAVEKYLLDNRCCVPCPAALLVAAWVTSRAPGRLGRRMPRGSEAFRSGPSLKGGVERNCPLSG